MKKRLLKNQNKKLVAPGISIGDIKPIVELGYYGGNKASVTGYIGGRTNSFLGEEWKKYREEERRLYPHSSPNVQGFVYEKLYNLLKDKKYGGGGYSTYGSYTTLTLNSFEIGN